MTAEPEDMRCSEVVEIVTHYLDGALDAATQTRVERHIAGCRGCTNYLGQIRIALDLLGRVGTENRGEPQSDELRAAFREWRAARPFSP